MILPHDSKATMNILVIDIGGTNVKIWTSGEEAVGDEIVELEHVSDRRAENGAEGQSLIPTFARMRMRIRLLGCGCHALIVFQAI